MPEKKIKKQITTVDIIIMTIGFVLVCTSLIGVLYKSLMGGFVTYCFAFLFGAFYPFILAFLFLLGFMLIIKRRGISWLHRATLKLGIYILLILSLALGSLSILRDNQDLSFSTMNQFYTSRMLSFGSQPFVIDDISSVGGLGGGYIGLFLNCLLSSMWGFTGNVAFFIILTVLSCLLIFTKPVVQLVTYIVKRVRGNVKYTSPYAVESKSKKSVIDIFKKRKDSQPVVEEELNPLSKMSELNSFSAGLSRASDDNAITTERVVDNLDNATNTLEASAEKVQDESQTVDTQITDDINQDTNDVAIENNSKETIKQSKFAPRQTPIDVESVKQSEFENDNTVDDIEETQISTNDDNQQQTKDSQVAPPLDDDITLNENQSDKEKPLSWIEKIKQKQQEAQKQAEIKAQQKAYQDAINKQKAKEEEQARIQAKQQLDEEKRKQAELLAQQKAKQDEQRKFQQQQLEKQKQFEQSQKLLQQQQEQKQRELDDAQRKLQQQQKELEEAQKKLKEQQDSLNFNAGRFDSFDQNSQASTNTNQTGDDSSKKSSFFSSLFKKKTQDSNDMAQSEITDSLPQSQIPPRQNSFDAFSQNQSNANNPRANLYGQNQTQDNIQKPTYPINPSPSPTVKVKYDDVKNSNLSKEEKDREIEKRYFAEKRRKQMDEAQRKIYEKNKRKADLMKFVSDVPKFYNYPLPSSNLLDVHDDSAKITKNSESAEEKVQIINSVFRDYGVKARVTSYTIGASVTRFNAETEPGERSDRIASLVDELQKALKGDKSVRVETVVEGQNTSGIEVGNIAPMAVSFKDIFSVVEHDYDEPLLLPIGKDISGNIVTYPLDKMPHLLVAGTTGSGKSVLVHSMIVTLMMRNYPSEMKLILIDPKQVEFVRYQQCSHLFCPVISKPEAAVLALKKLCDEMDRRFAILSKYRVANLDGYNQLRSQGREAVMEQLPKLVCVIDEFADLMMIGGKDVATYVQRIGQKARAAGIHMIIATQRPSKDNVPMMIKANVPCRIGLSCSSQVDSRVILDENGAETLLGRGDLLFKSPVKKSLIRAQSPFLSDVEIDKVLDYIKLYAGDPLYDEEFIELEDIEDDSHDNIDTSKKLYDDVKDFVIHTGITSKESITRNFQMTNSKADNFLLTMVSEGVLMMGYDGAYVLGPKAVSALQQEYDK